MVNMVTKTIAGSSRREALDAYLAAHRRASLSEVKSSGTQKLGHVGQLENVFQNWEETFVWDQKAIKHARSLAAACSLKLTETEVKDRVLAGDLLDKMAAAEKQLWKAVFDVVLPFAQEADQATPQVKAKTERDQLIDLLAKAVMNGEKDEVEKLSRQLTELKE